MKLKSATVKGSTLSRVSPEVRDAFQPIIVALDNWGPEIMACFDHPIINAYY